MGLELLECNAAYVYTIFLFEQCKKSPHITLKICQKSVTTVYGSINQTAGLNRVKSFET